MTNINDDGFKKSITREEYLQIFALFTMANIHATKCFEFESAMNRLVRPGCTDAGGGHLGDAIFSTAPATIEVFDECLRREGVEVENGEAK